MSPDLEEVAMFVHECSSCHRRQLIFPSQFSGVAATEGGVQVSFACWCGAEESALMTSMLDEELSAA